MGPPGRPPTAARSRPSAAEARVERPRWHASTPARRLAAGGHPAHRHPSSRTICTGAGGGRSFRRSPRALARQTASGARQCVAVVTWENGVQHPSACLHQGWHNPHHHDGPAPQTMMDVSLPADTRPGDGAKASMWVSSCSGRPLRPLLATRPLLRAGVCRSNCSNSVAGCRLAGSRGTGRGPIRSRRVSEKEHTAQIWSYFHTEPVGVVCPFRESHEGHSTVYSMTRLCVDRPAGIPILRRSRGTRGGARLPFSLHYFLCQVA